ncbi:MAG: hypothetical protein WCY62_08655 [Clostridia bacterium]|jgi:hypothetical protein
MDSKKAMKILVVLMILVNLIMAGYIISLAVSQSQQRIDNKYIMSILEYRGITLECDIDNSSTPVFKLKHTDDVNDEVYQYLLLRDGVTTRSDDGMVITFIPAVTQRYENIDLDTAEVIARDFMEALPVEQNPYVLDYRQTTGVGTYSFQFNFYDSNSYIYDKYVKIQVSKNGIIEAVIGSISYEVENSGYTASDISIGNILVSNFTRQGISQMVLRKIDSGYLYIKETGQIEAVWRVLYNENQVRYFLTKDGEEVIR